MVSDNWEVPASWWILRITRHKGCTNYVITEEIAQKTLAYLRNPPLNAIIEKDIYGDQFVYFTKDVFTLYSVTERGRRRDAEMGAVLDKQARDWKREYDPEGIL